MFSKSYYLIPLLLLEILLVNCARKGVPTGGEKDITPPLLVRAIPDTAQINVPTNIKDIKLYFDEYILLKDFSQNFLISPPLDPIPIVTPIGIPDDKIKISLNSNLRPNTTYTLNFGQSIRDYNEGNLLPFFSYVFSTGPFIDSLQIKGKVDFPFKKDKIKNIITALYPVDSSYTDSIIYKEKPFYIAKLDSANQFNLKNLRAGQYRLIAFNDEIPNLKYDVNKENFGFYTEIINPETSSNVLINLYKPEKKFKFLEAKQLEQGKLAFYFEGKPKNIDIKLLSHKFKTQQVIHNPYSDTLTYYFNPTATGDTLQEKRPALKFLVTHEEKSDSIPTLFYDKKKITPLNIYAKKLQYAPGKIYQIEANYPIDSINKSFISIKKDSTSIDFETNKLSYNRFGLNFPIEFEANYKIVLYPNAITDIMQRTNDTLKLDLKINSEREFGNLLIKIKNKPSNPTWLKLFNSNNNEIESIYSDNDTFTFKNLFPGTYTAQLISDENSNEKYDTGNFIKNKQPEPIYNYPSPIIIKAFWDVDETWIIGKDDTLPEEKNNSAITIPENLIIDKPKNN